jgi:hypothetical protein
MRLALPMVVHVGRLGSSFYEDDVFDVCVCVCVFTFLKGLSTVTYTSRNENLYFDRPLVRKWASQI